MVLRTIWPGRITAIPPHLPSFYIVLAAALAVRLSIDVMARCGRKRDYEDPHFPQKTQSPTVAGPWWDGQSQEYGWTGVHTDDHCSKGNRTAQQTKHNWPQSSPAYGSAPHPLLSATIKPSHRPIAPRPPTGIDACSCSEWVTTAPKQPRLVNAWRIVASN